MSKKALSFSTALVVLILIFSLVGELFRLKGFLLLDIFAPILCLAWILQAFLRKKSIKLPKTFFPVLIFLCIGFGSLLINSVELSTAHFLESASYGMRFASLYFLSVIVLNQSADEKNLGWISLCVFTLLLSIAGFIQLKLFSDFSIYEKLGWDPHFNRLLSTWFDPNFVGGFLAFMIPLFLGKILEKKTLSYVLIALSGIALIALALTLSRSAYLALITGVTVFGLIKSIKTLAIGAALFVLLVVFIPSVQTRVLSLATSVESVFTENYTLPDASSRLRFDSWEEAWTLFLDRPLLGQGYNRYKYAALELGTLNDLSSHSASGSDSSLLNILATTGLLGFSPFLTAYVLLAATALKNRSAYNTGFFAALCGLFIHAVFVNSLLFPLFMAPFWISAGMLKER